MSTHTADQKEMNDKKVAPLAATAGADVETSAAESNGELVKTESHSLSFSDIESVDQLRDELSLQAHLLRSELKERFEKIEKEWPILNVQIEPIRTATQQAGADVTAAVRLLFDTIRDSYKDIKRSASTH